MKEGSKAWSLYPKNKKNKKTKKKTFISIKQLVPSKHTKKFLGVLYETINLGSWFGASCTKSI
jgi:hypothetical protein